VDIKKNSKDLLETLSSRSQYVCNSFKTFDFSTLYTTITHTPLNLVIGRDKYHFVKNHSKDNNKYKHEIIQMLDFLIDNIFVLFGGRGFQQTIGIPMGYDLCSVICRFASTCL